MAHFLGAGGASKFLNAMKESPNRLGRDLFPDAAASNQNVFYNKSSGEPATLKQIYDRFSKRFSDDGDIVASSAAARRIQYGMPDGFDVQVPDIPAKALRSSPLAMYHVLALNALELALFPADDARALFLLEALPRLATAAHPPDSKPRRA